MKYKWNAKNINNKVIIEDKDTFGLFLSTLPENISVTVGRRTKQRSGQQNKYYWGVCVPLISEETGYTHDEVHDILKSKFNSEVINVGKDEITVAKSTASLTTMEFESYISRIVQWASFTLGIIIPNPNEVEA